MSFPDSERLIRTEDQRSDSSDGIVIDNESDIIDPAFDDEAYGDGICRASEPRHFVFPSSPSKDLKRQRCLRGAIDFFRPMLPQISTRSLRRNTESLSERHRAFMVNHRRECRESDAFDLDDGPSLSQWSAAFLIVNLYSGPVLLAAPFCLAEGGLICLVPAAAVCFVMARTGKFVVRCFDRMRPAKRSYSDVGYKSFGRCGSALIALAVGTECLGALCAVTILLWKNTEVLFGSFSVRPSMPWICGLSAAAALPTLWTLDLPQMPFVQFLGAIWKALLVFVAAVAFVSNIDAVSDHLRSGDIAIWPKDARSLSVALGIFVFSFAGHPVLPAVYAAMREPERFEIVLDRCFMALFAVHSAVALFGALPFAAGTDLVVTANLADSDGRDTESGQLFVAQTLLMLIVPGLFLELSPILSVMAEVTESTLCAVNGPILRRLWRTLLFLLSVAISYSAVDHLAVLMAVAGALCTTTVSIVCPAMFYFAIFRNYTSYFQRVALIAMAATAALCALFLLFNQIIYVAL